jgi:dolichyl-diphosphooligosaccharide--protein glycosyltransferase
VAVLAALCGLALYLRIHPGYGYTFVGDAVWFRETDAYFYLRNIESVVHNFPHFNYFDPYMLYPGGGGLSRPLFVWLAAAAALIVGGGNPTTHTIATVSAYLPAVLGTLTLIPVYFIGKELFSRWAGLIAATLVAIIPGELLHRSLLGFTDHHVAETLFTTTAALFLIMAIKRFRDREITFHHLLTRNWSVITKPLVYAMLVGLFLGLYLLAWGGGLMFAFIMFVYLVVQFFIDYLRHRSTDYLCLISVPLFLAALLVLVVGVSGRIDTFSVMSLAIAALVPVVLNIVAGFVQARNWRPAYYFLSLLVLAGIGLVVLRLISPTMFSSLSSSFSFLAPSSAMRTVIEATPLSLQYAWSNFTTSFFIAFVTLAILIYTAVREKGAARILLLVWSLIMLMSNLSQRRFGYYYTVNVALLTGYLSWELMNRVGLRGLLSQPKRVSGVIKEFRKRKKSNSHSEQEALARSRSAWAWTRAIIIGVVIFFLVFFPNIRPAEGLASSQSGIQATLARGWHESCLWLKDNTPEPFGDPDYYYQLYPRPLKDYRDFEYPDTVYAVLSWWDYGYFITQIGHRVPNANPGQAGAGEAGRFFTAQNETAANELADQRMSKYVMIDADMVTGKFYAMVEWAGGNMSEFNEVCFVPSQTREGWLDPVVLYYPAYYRSMAVRLYTFDGKAVTPTESLVVQYDNRVDPNGTPYRLITGAQRFSTYEEAEAYIATQGPGNYRIASSNPLTSPVPLDAVVDYELVYSSPTGVSVVDRVMPGVKVFEYLGLPYA